MTFDPDKFLAETEPVETKSSFDPDAFLAETEVESEPSKIGELATSAKETTQDILTGLADTGLGHVAAGASSAVTSLSPIDKLLTYLARTPEQQAMEEKAMEQFAAADDKPLKVTTPETSLADEYKRGQDTLKQSIAEAKERSPLAAGGASLAGNIGEGVALGAGLGAAAKASKALQGVKAGAQGITSRLGALQKPAELAALAGAEGALVSAAKGEDISQGAKTGAVFGGAAGTLLPAAKVIARESADLFKSVFKGKGGDQLKRIYELGGEGVDVFDPRFADEIAASAEQIGKDTIDKVSKTRKTLGDKLNKIRKDNLGTDTVNIEKTVTSKLNELDALQKRVISESGAENKSIETLQNYIEDVVQTSDLKNMPLDKIAKLNDEMRDLITDFNSPSRIKDKEVAAFARKMSKTLNDDIDNIVSATIQNREIAKGISKNLTNVIKSDPSLSGDISKKLADDINNVITTNFKTSSILDEDLSKRLTDDINTIINANIKDNPALAGNISRKLTGNIDNVIADNAKNSSVSVLEELDKAKDMYGKLADLETKIGIRGKKGPKFLKSDIDKKVEGFADTLTRDKSLKDLVKNKGFYDSMKDAGFSGAEIDSLKSNIDQLATDFDIIKTINPSENINAFGRLIRNVQTAVPLKAGKAGRAVEEGVTKPIKKGIADMKSLIEKVKTSRPAQSVANAVTKSSEKLRNASPEQLVKMADTMPDALGKRLRTIADQTDVDKRAAYIHALSQQPAFRQYFKEDDDE